MFSAFAVIFLTYSPLLYCWQRYGSRVHVQVKTRAFTVLATESTDFLGSLDRRRVTVLLILF